MIYSEKKEMEIRMVLLWNNDKWLLKNCNFLLTVKFSIHSFRNDSVFVNYSITPIIDNCLVISFQNRWLRFETFVCMGLKGLGILPILNDDEDMATDVTTDQSLVTRGTGYNVCQSGTGAYTTRVHSSAFGQA